MAADIARASGINNAIVIHTQPTTNPSIEIDDHALTREQALRLTLENDPRIQAAIAHVRAAQADADQARLFPNPVFNIDMRFPETGGTQVVETSLTGDLIAVLSMPGHIKAADQRLRATSADALSTALDVISEVLNAYASAQSIDAQIPIIEKRQKILHRLRDVASNRLNAGEGTRLDVLTLDSQQVEIELELADKRLERTNQRLALARLIGQPRAGADWQLEPWQVPSRIGAAESTWIDQALESRPEIQSRKWELNALGEEVKLATLSPLNGGEIGGHGERDGSWDTGPTFTTPLPIFDFGQAARAKAKAERLAAYHELDQQQREVIEDIRGAYADYIASRDALEATQNRLIPLQQQQRDQAETAYKSGEVDLTTLLLAETDLQESEAKIIDMQQKLSQAVIHLERAAGGAGVAAALEDVPPTTSPATTESTSNGGSTP